MDDVKKEPEFVEKVNKPMPMSPMVLIGLILLLSLTTGAIGYMLGQRAPQLLTIQPQPSTIVQSSPLTGSQAPNNDLANWKTLTSNLYGYSLKYPSFWYERTGTITRSLDQIESYDSFKNTGGPNVFQKGQTRIEIGYPETGKTSLSVDEWFAKQGASYISKVHINVGSNDSLMVTDDSPIGKSVIYYLKNGTSILTIAVYGDLTEENGKILDQILSTFKFTDAQSDATANWRTVTGKYLIFEAPSNWHYLACDNNDYNIFVGPKISQDSTEHCAFDGSPGDIQILRAVNAASFYIAQDTDPNDSYTISEKSSLKVDGVDAITQREVETEGQGQGDRYVVYIPSKLTTIVLHNNTEKQLFDQILSTFKFTN
jgi:hypothetical protein